MASATKGIELSSTDIIARFVVDLEDPDAIGPVSAEEAREGLVAYCRYKTRGFWRPFPHLRLLTDKLEAVERGEITRLIITMPPRHGKSETASKSFPSWFMGRNPQKRVAVASYTVDLAEECGRQNRDDMEGFGKELWNLRVAEGSKAAKRWDLAGRRGGFRAVGIGGSLTGFGAHLLIIDDPHKDWEEAQSVKMRERVKNWYRSVARTRLQKGGAIIVIQTRWHEDDLSGWLLAEMKAGTGEKWEVLHIPCEAEANDILGRQVGEALCPDLGFDREWMDATKQSVGTYIWNALYQGRPAPIEGGIVKRHWWRYWQPKGMKLPPVTVRLPNGEYADIEAVELDLYDQFDTALQSWDMAFKETHDSDFVAGGVLGRKGANMFVWDMTNERIDFPKSVAAVEAKARKWPRARPILVEDKANGPAVVSTLKTKIPGILEVTPEGGKEARLHAASPFVEAGNAYLPHPMLEPLTDLLIVQAALMPNGPNDDLVDMFTQGVLRLVNGGGNTAVLDFYRQQAQQKQQQEG
jgi:predicted phage terminase large subunit-like protein